MKMIHHICYDKGVTVHPPKRAKKKQAYPFPNKSQLTCMLTLQNKHITNESV